MKILLLKDVYKLGRAGDVKNVADGYGRNYLLPQGLAVMASEGAIKQADRIQKAAAAERARLNEELSSVAEVLEGLEMAFPVKAGETGKLYGSVTTQMIADSIEAETGAIVEKRQIDSEPIRALGVHEISVRLTIDLVPQVTVLVHREGEPAESAYEIVQEEEQEAPTEAFADLREELQAEDTTTVEGGEMVDEESPAELVDEPIQEIVDQPEKLPDLEAEFDQDLE